LRRALLRHAEEGVSVLLGILLFATILWQVFTRYVLNDPSIWSEEAARYLYVGVVFFGAAAAVRDRSHIGMPFLLERLPPGPALAVTLATRALTVGFCAAIAVWGARAAWREWDLPSLALEIPMGLVLAAVPVSMALAGIRTVIGMAEDVAAWREGRVLAAAAARDL
jgi:TRAP-type C4-dicarboxylate transport system permease small subunit